MNKTRILCGLACVSVLIALLGLAGCRESSEDDEKQVTCYRDADEDRYGDPEVSQEFKGSECPDGWVGNDLDCNDDWLGNGDRMSPRMQEVCDGLDNNCSGEIDEGGDSLCDDGLFCTGEETCAGASGCKRGPTPCHISSHVCRPDEYCNEQANACYPAEEPCVDEPGTTCCEEFYYYGYLCNHSPVLTDVMYLVNDEPADPPIVIAASDELGIVFGYSDDDCNLNGGYCHVEEDGEEYELDFDYWDDMGCSDEDSGYMFGYLVSEPFLAPGPHSLSTYWVDNCGDESNVMETEYTVVEDLSARESAVEESESGLFVEFPENAD